MKEHDPIEDNEPLSKALRAWKSDVSLPSRFQEGVWQRIARAESEPKLTFWIAWKGLIESALPRPAFAALYLTVLVALGAVTGAWQARTQAIRLDVALSSRYVESVDPYQARPH